MESIVIVFVWILTALCVWSAVGCMVRAVQYRYGPLGWLSLFFVLIGWLLRSVGGVLSAPLWIGGPASIVLGLYRMGVHRVLPPASLGVTQILCWWVAPAREHSV